MGKGKGNAGRSGRGGREQPAVTRNPGGKTLGISSRDTPTVAAAKRRASRGGLVGGDQSPPGRDQVLPRSNRTALTGPRLKGSSAAQAQSQAAARARLAAGAAKTPGRIARAVGALKAAFTRRRSG